MGATNFSTIAVGKTADDAMKAARADALYWNGHGGYSGTIAEKHGCIEFALPAHVSGPRFEETVWQALWERDDAEGARWRGEEPAPAEHLAVLVGWLGARDAERVLDTARDKWGPAVAVRLGRTADDRYVPRTPTGKRKAGYHAYLFFGYASC
jgi:hypothetical protein